jgi:DNA-directed RNA polymerase sigma subunit (sigma70/sigma32)
MSTAHDWLRRDGMTVREIARALRISPMRVRQLEQRALEKLRENPGLLRQYARELFEPGDGAKENAHP